MRMSALLPAAYAGSGSSQRTFVKGAFMSIEKARMYLASRGLEDRIIIPEASSATVELAARALGTEPGQIAKTMSFLLDDQPILILTEGTARIDNRKFKDRFHKKAKMIPPDRVEELVGHSPGGVCPFGTNEGIPVYLDGSLKKYDVVYPAAGTDHSAVRLTVQELEDCLEAEWVDVCR